MRREKDMTRNLMLELRKGVVINKVEDVLKNYHIELLVQAGWVEWDNCFSCDAYHLYFDLRLTWDGNEVADLLSNEANWEEVKTLYDTDQVPFDMILDVMRKQAT